MRHRMFWVVYPLGKFVASKKGITNCNVLFFALCVVIVAHFRDALVAQRRFK